MLLTDDLEHLSDEDVKIVLEIFPKISKNSSESTNEVSKVESAPNGNAENAEVDKKPTTPKLNEESWKDGYVDYEKKTKDSDRVTFLEDEIEIIEEEF